MAWNDLDLVDETTVGAQVVPKRSPLALGVTAHDSQVNFSLQAPEVVGTP